ncbi:hypothetical protein ABT033_00270 [Streptomyces pharetrae]|uniref:hypothetical protein n=1 Tax=Streptomyces pharetrae TaxID=291370 RepID=UPI003348B90A
MVERGQRTQFVLTAGLAVISGTTTWHLATDTGAGAFSRLSTPMTALALVALPLVLAGLMLRSGRRKGSERLTRGFRRG